MVTDYKMAASFVVNFPGEKENENPEQCTLQDAFVKFRKKRQKELRRDLCLSREQKLEPRRMDELRRKFVETALRYIGVPYARRYHDPSSPTYNSKLFLDCCGLVRKVLKDLQDYFGFLIGPGNQAYQFDTLPTSVEREAMKPGDLVFISGTYVDSKKKPQKHDMVHVEIWLGEGEKTIGARWQKGCVEVHESYKFESKSYHSMVYHFRSIDTWLMGECRSHCKEHSWQPRLCFVPGKKSIFSLSDDMEESADPQDDETCHVTSCDIKQPPDQVLQDISESGNNPDLPSELSGSGRLSTGQENGHAQVGKSSKLPKAPSLHQDTPKSTTKPKMVVKSTKSSRPKFYIGGKNGGCIVEGHLLQRGWERIFDNNTSHFYLKWVELKSQIQYPLFKEGEQLVNHISNIGLLTTKIGLLESLQELNRTQSKLSGRRLPEVSSFYPQTLRLDNPQQRAEFFSKFKGGGRWICKPSGMNQGKGIFLVESAEQVQDILKKDEAVSTPSRRPVGRVVQRYLEAPLLLSGRKFDVRAYMLLIAGTPFVALYHHGYLRLTCCKYDPTSKDPGVHLTNQFVQKKQYLYQEVKEDTVWSYQQLQHYLSEHYKEQLPSNWVDTTLKLTMQSIMKACLRSVEGKLERKLGYFDLLGFDFMIDSDFKVWLIEVNVNPAMHTTCGVLQELIPNLLHSTLDVTIDVFERLRHGKALPDLDKYGFYEVLKT